MYLNTMYGFVCPCKETQAYYHSFITNMKLNLQIAQLYERSI